MLYQPKYYNAVFHARCINFVCNLVTTGLVKDKSKDAQSLHNCQAQANNEIILGLQQNCKTIKVKLKKVPNEQTTTSENMQIIIPIIKFTC